MIKMVPLNHLWRCLSLLLSVSGFSGSIIAQNVIFTAAAKESKIGVKDRVQVQFIVKDARNLQSITPLVTPDFVIVAGPFQEHTSEGTTINHKTTQTQSVSITYIIQPRREGNFIIPPATAKDGNGHTYVSNPVTIEVVPQKALTESRKPIR
jgi:BatD DUF11 like domain